MCGFVACLQKDSRKLNRPLQYLPVHPPLSCALVRVSSPVVTDRSGERARRPSGEEGGGLKAHKKKGKKGKHRSGSASHRSHRSHGTGSGSGRTSVAPGPLAIALLSLQVAGVSLAGCCSSFRSKVLMLLYVAGKSTGRTSGRTSGRSTNRLSKYGLMELKDRAAELIQVCVGCIPPHAAAFPVKLGVTELHVFYT
jgi:hypothetical protein